MQVLVEYAMYVYQGKMPMSGGGAEHHWRCEDTGLTSRSYNIVGSLACTQQSISMKILPRRTEVASPCRVSPIEVTR